MSPSEDEVMASSTTAAKARTAGQMRTLAWWLDASIRVPFSQFRIGLDSLVGLVPGFGDAVGAAASGVIVVQAWRMGASPATLLRMLANLAIEAIVGLVPILGDLFDMAFKANLRNVKLALAQIDQSEAASGHRGSRAGVQWLIGIGVAIVALTIACFAVFLWMLAKLFGGG